MGHLQQNLHEVQYDEGDREVLHLDSENWQLLRPSPATAATDSAAQEQVHPAAGQEVGTASCSEWHMYVDMAISTYLDGGVGAVQTKRSCMY